MPGQSFAYTFRDATGAVFKNETVSFHGPNRMIFEEAANGVAMITVYEKQWNKLVNIVSRNLFWIREITNKSL